MTERRRSEDGHIEALFRQYEKDQKELAELRRQHQAETLERYEAGHRDVHAALAKSIELAQANMEFRLENLNNWKKQNEEERGSLVERGRFEAVVDGFNRQMASDKEAIEHRFGVIEKTLASAAGRSTAITAGIVVLFTAIQIGIAIWSNIRR